MPPLVVVAVVFVSADDFCVDVAVDAAVVSVV